MDRWEQAFINKKKLERFQNTFTAKKINNFVNYPRR